jgi:hypothetical protein
MIKDAVERESLRMNQRSLTSTSTLVVALMLVLTNLPVIRSSDIAVAGQKEDVQLQDFIMGEVTGKRENAIRIDSKEYPFFSDVIVKDQNLTPMALKDVVPGTQVMFHLKQGRIDQIIILLPS